MAIAFKCGDPAHPPVRGLRPCPLCELEKGSPVLTRTVMVRCTFALPVEMPADYSDDQIRFVIEDNGCPETGPVGMAWRELMRRHEGAGTCWACAVGGECEVVGITNDFAMRGGG